MVASELEFSLSIGISNDVCDVLKFSADVADEAEGSALVPFSWVVASSQLILNLVTLGSEARILRAT